jgi:hypothetical protein
MNGGAASYVVAVDEFAYSDLDLIFPINIDTEAVFDKASSRIASAQLVFVYRCVRRYSMRFWN